jgi:thiol-disulfide isomerase/thioredoxin
MKNLYLAVSIILIASCGQQSQSHLSNLPDKMTTLSGHIDNYYDSLPKTISLLIYEIATGKQKSFVQEIDSIGTFSFNFNLYFPQDFYLDYNQQTSEILLEPGDSLFVDFNPDDLCGSIKFNGTKATLNKQVRKFLNEFGTYWDKNGDVTSKVRNVSPNDYKQLVYKQQSFYDSIADKFIRENNPQPTASTWIKTYMKYKGGNDILQVYFSVKNVPDDYWDFTSKYPVDNPDQFLCSEFHLYLNRYNSTYFVRAKPLDKATNFYKNKDYANYLKLYADSISKKYTGFSRDELLTQACFNISQKDYKIVDSLLTINLIKINSEILLNQLKTELSALKETSFSNDPEIKFIRQNSIRGKGEFLSNLVHDNFQGKVVYVDFWATWCSPCMVEIPFSQSLHKRFDDNKIAFIYICCDSGEKAWQKIVSENKMTGDHIFLNGDQFAYLREKYQIPGFPTYMIFDKNGSLVDKNAPRPSSKEIENILTQLIKK